LPAFDAAVPIFRRLDARDFRASEYLLELRMGKGILLACTLGLTGGYGKQPGDLGRNVAGQALFRAMQDYLEEER
jgi:hypothetical protein